MGFADISLAEIATEYNLPVESIFTLCNQLGINYKNQQTCLALEDAKTLISYVLSKQTSRIEKNSTN